MYYYAKKDMYIFTEDEKKQAKNVSTLAFLEQTYGFTFKKQGSFYRCIEHDSLVIRSDCKGWYWNSRKEGGADVLQWLQNIENKTYEQALVTVLHAVPDNKNSAPPKSPYVQAPAKQPEEKELLMPPRVNGQYKCVFAYLTKTRCIDPSIVNTLMHHNYLYEDTRHNCVFVGYDKVGFPAYATIRTTLSDVRYRKDVYGSKKANGFYLQGQIKDTVYVFESPIDLLSHATICNLYGGNKEWLKYSRLSLGGVSDVALDHYLKNYPEVKKIRLCLDNDPAGITASEKMTAKYIPLGYDVRSIPPEKKDYNDDLKEIINKPKKVKQTRI